MSSEKQKLLAATEPVVHVPAIQLRQTDYAVDMKNKELRISSIHQLCRELTSPCDTAVKVFSSENTKHRRRSLVSPHHIAHAQVLLPELEIAPPYFGILDGSIRSRNFEMLMSPLITKRWSSL
ncbi:hypothetical protein BaRGS_00008506 [Batillaria attramentaria]|uniref:Uncharacterized protein n=1 Tax=Batillaria attramentaria TaxID=370345 RepID=A0ABD0LMP8_9CAEN